MATAAGRLDVPLAEPADPVQHGAPAEVVGPVQLAGVGAGEDDAVRAGDHHRGGTGVGPGGLGRHPGVGDTAVRHRVAEGARAGQLLGDRLRPPALDLVGPPVDWATVTAVTPTRTTKMITTCSASSWPASESRRVRAPPDVDDGNAASPPRLVRARTVDTTNTKPMRTQG